jgi:hypothetical protein
MSDLMLLLVTSGVLSGGDGMKHPPLLDSIKILKHYAPHYESREGADGSPRGAGLGTIEDRVKSYEYQFRGRGLDTVKLV